MKYTNGKNADPSSFPFKVEAPKPGSSPAKEVGAESAGQGAIKGALAGSAFGPWGAVIGGAIGGIKGAAEKKRLAREAKKARKEEYEQSELMRKSKAFADSHKPEVSDRYEDGTEIKNAPRSNPWEEDTASGDQKQVGKETASEGLV